MSMLRQRLENRRIQPEFRFIGLGVSQDEEDDFRNIAGATGGEVSIVHSRAELAEVLEKILELDPVGESIASVVTNLERFTDRLREAIEHIAGKDFGKAAAKIDSLTDIVDDGNLPFRDLSRRKSKPEFEKLSAIASAMRGTQREMLETVHALVAHRRSGDTDAYNGSVDRYNDLTAQYGKSVDDANDILRELRK